MNKKLIVKTIIDDISKSVNNSWTKEEKIRYVYISLGKLLNKNVKFFYSLGHKLENKNYTYEQIKNIYESKRLYTTNVICKSVALILMRIYKKIGINCELIKTTSCATFIEDDKKINIHHYFLSVNGTDNKNYFLTLIPDLYNIQYNMPTKHFANYIEYKRLNKKTGKYEQVYEGKEIIPTILSDEELKKIDEKIGYLHSYTINKNKKELTYDDIFLDNLRDFIKQYGYYRCLALETDFYKQIMNYKVNNNLTIKEYLNDGFSEIKDLDPWFNYINKKLKERLYNTNNKLYNESIGKVKTLRKYVLEKKNNRFRMVFELLCAEFIDEKYKIKNDGTCTTPYITKKFETLFPKIFNCNEKSNPITKCFNGLAEQLDFIDKILEIMFCELKNDNTNNDIVTNPKTTIIKNRIKRSVIYNKKNNEYNIIFSIDNKNIYYYFNPNSGEFRKIKNILELISDNNIIINDELKNKMKKVENIEYTKKLKYK